MQRERNLIVGIRELRVGRAFVRIALAQQAREHLLDEARDVDRGDVLQRRHVGEARREFARQRREFHAARERVGCIEDDRDQREFVVVRGDAAARVLGQRRQRLVQRTGPVIDETRQQRQRARRKLVVGESMRELPRGGRERLRLLDLADGDVAHGFGGECKRHFGAVTDGVRANDDVLREPRDCVAPTW